MAICGSNGTRKTEHSFNISEKFQNQNTKRMIGIVTLLAGSILGVLVHGWVSRLVAPK